MSLGLVCSSLFPMIEDEQEQKEKDPIIFWMQELKDQNLMPIRNKIFKYSNPDILRGVLEYSHQNLYPWFLNALKNRSKNFYTYTVGREKDDQKVYFKLARYTPQITCTAMENVVFNAIVRRMNQGRSRFVFFDPSLHVVDFAPSTDLSLFFLVCRNDEDDSFFGYVYDRLAPKDYKYKGPYPLDKDWFEGEDLSEVVKWRFLCAITNDGKIGALAKYHQNEPKIKMRAIDLASNTILQEKEIQKGLSLRCSNILFNTQGTFLKADVTCTTLGEIHLGRDEMQDQEEAFSMYL